MIDDVEIQNEKDYYDKYCGYERAVRRRNRRIKKLPGIRNIQSMTLEEARIFVEKYSGFFDLQYPDHEAADIYFEPDDFLVESMDNPRMFGGIEITGEEDDLDYAMCIKVTHELIDERFKDDLFSMCEKIEREESLLL